jgi:hypothetical protein
MQQLALIMLNACGVAGVLLLLVACHCRLSPAGAKPRSRSGGALQPSQSGLMLLAAPTGREHVVRVLAYVRPLDMVVRLLVLMLHRLTCCSGSRRGESSSPGRGSQPTQACFLLFAALCCCLWNISSLMSLCVWLFFRPCCPSLL